VIIFIVPKNSGLTICKEIIKNYNLSGKYLEVRGEDVPLITSKLISQENKVIGITGEDLFKEFSIKNYNSRLKIIERIKWDDSECIFGKPTLCLLGPKTKKFSDMPKELKVCINSKYKCLAKKCCLSILENKGYRIEKIYASGATEEFFSNGVVDLVIDIVCSGKSAEEAGLCVYEKIFQSDIVLIGGKYEN